jgi:hypothetical protein
MSDKIEMIAAAQINADASGIAFKSNVGFKTATRSSAGVYDLALDDKHDAHKLVINVTANNLAGNDIQASPVGTGDTRNIAITNFASGDAAADSPFFITVWRVRS